MKGECTALVALSPSVWDRVLALSTIALTVCFAVWSLISIVGVKTVRELGFKDSEIGIFIDSPRLTGALHHKIPDLVRGALAWAPRLTGIPIRQWFGVDLAQLGVLTATSEFTKILP